MFDWSRQRGGMALWAAPSASDSRDAVLGD
jgi:hypothetical protein